MADEKPEAPAEPARGRAAPSSAAPEITARQYAERTGLRRGHLALLERRVGARTSLTAARLAEELAKALKEKI